MVIRTTKLKVVINKFDIQNMEIPSLFSAGNKMALSYLRDASSERIVATEKITA